VDISRPNNSYCFYVFYVRLMDVPVSFVQLRRPRSSPLRRRDNEMPSVMAGPSRLTNSTQINLNDIPPAQPSVEEDEEQDQHPTPRMNTTSTLLPTPNLAGRLRELIQLVPNGSASNVTPIVHQPPSPAFHESDFENDSTSGGHSRARESLRDIFSKALREPGDTPQKGRPRSSSDTTASESDALPASVNSRRKLCVS